MKALLEIKNLEKKFGERKVVEKLSFKINEREILGFLGPNGAGKSTTISMITTILDKDSGEVIFNGRRVSENDKGFKRALGLVPQDIALFSDLTAYENIKFFASLYGLKGVTLNKRVKETLELVGLYDRKDNYPDSFSGGMKRRLNIACSIAHKPQILIMDEPTVGIDPQSRNKILEVTKGLRDSGTSVIYTSHYMEEVESICSRLIIIDNGRVIEEGEKEYIKAKYRDKGLNNLEEIFLYVTGKELRD
ncbi:MAG: ABC transporter ATP-binding protein [Clostridium sp.]